MHIWLSLLGPKLKTRTKLRDAISYSVIHKVLAVWGLIVAEGIVQLLGLLLETAICFHADLT